MKKIYTFLALLITLLSVSAQTTLPIACFFDASDTLPGDWTLEVADPNSFNLEMTGVAPLSLYGSAVTPYSAPNVFCFASQMNATDYNQYLISPRINNSTSDSVQLRLMYAAEDCWGNIESFRIGYCTANTYSLSQVVWQTSDIHTSTTVWQSLVVNLPANTQYVVINYHVTESQCALYIDNVLLRADTGGITYPVTVNATAGGTVSPGSSAVPESSDFTFTVTPDLGYEIQSVLLDGVDLHVSGTLPFSYTIQHVMEPHQVDVAFLLRTNAIFVSVGSGGTVTPDGGANHNVFVPWGHDTTFYFHPDLDYHVNDVVVDYSWHGGTLSEYTFRNVTSNHVIQVSFAPDEYQIVSTAGLHGTITPAGTIPASQGDTLSFRIEPDTGYLIDSLLVDGQPFLSFNPMGYTYVFQNIHDNHTITALFRPQQFLVYSESAVGGSSSLTGGTVVGQDSLMVAYGEHVTVTFQTDNGYQLANVLVNGVPLDTFSNPLLLTITENTAISPVFQELTYSIQVNRYGPGVVSPLSVENVRFSQVSTFNITPNYCAVVDSILMDGAPMTLLNQLAFSELSGSHVLSVYFSHLYYTMTLIPASHGTITASNGSVTCDATVQFSILPDSCYRPTHFYVDGIQRDELMTNVFGNWNATLSHINEDHQISADFEMIDYQVEVTKTGAGTISHQGITVVDCGESLSFVVIPDECHRIASLWVNGESFTDVTWHSASHPGFSDTAYFALENIGQDYEVSVVFSPMQYLLTLSSSIGGTVSPENEVSVQCGDNQTVEMIPNPCYRVQAVYVDEESVTSSLVWNGDVATYTFADVRADHSLRAEFRLLHDTVHLVAEGNGQVNLLTDSVVACGGYFSFEAVPDECYQMDSLMVDGILVNGHASYRPNENPYIGDSVFYSMNSVIENHDIRVVFSPIHYSYSYGFIGDGEVTSSLAGPVLNCGDDLSLILTPAECQRIEVVYVNGEEFSDIQLDAHGIGHIHLYDLRQDLGVGVVFSPMYYQTEIVQPLHAQIQLQPQYWSCGDDLQLELTVDDCYQLDTLYVNDMPIPVSSLTQVEDAYQYVMTDVREDLQISASVTPQQVHFASTDGAPLSISDTTLLCGSPLRVGMRLDSCHHFEFIRLNGNRFEASSIPNVLTSVQTEDSLFFNFLSITEDLTFDVYISATTYQFAVTTNGFGHATYEGGSRFNCGDSIAVSISSYPCYHLSAVRLNTTLVDVDNDTLLIINSLQEDLQIRLEFEKDQYLMQTHAVGNGRIVGATGMQDCGRNLQYTFVPRDCSHLDSVFVDGVCVNALLDTIGGNIQYEFASLSAPHTIEATFSMDEFQLVTVADGYATLDIPSLVTVPCGGVVNFTVTPAECHYIADVLLDGVSILTTMPANGQGYSGRIANIRGNHQLEVTTGTIAVEVSQSVRNSETQEVMATAVSSMYCGNDTTLYVTTPNDCWVVDSVVVNGEAQPIHSSYSYVAVTSNIEMNVYLHHQQFVVEYRNYDHCTLSHEAAVTVACGEDYLLSGEPESGYTLLGWLLDGDSVAPSYEILQIHANHTVEPILQLNSFEIQTFVQGNGSVTPSSPVVNYGDDVTLDFIPDDCQMVASIIVDGEEFIGLQHYTFHHVTQDHQVVAHFRQRIDTLYATVGAHGTILINDTAVTAENLVVCGSDVTLVFKTDDCYELGAVFVDGVMRNQELVFENDLAYLTLPSMQGNHSVLALINPVRYIFDATCNYGGAISPSSAMPMCGTDFTFTIAPLDCYELDSVWIDGVYFEMDSFTQVGDQFFYTFTDYRENHHVTVRFKGRVFQFDIDHDGHSSVIVEQVGGNCAGDITFTIVPEQCEQIDNVYLNETNINHLLAHHPNTDTSLGDTLIYTISHISSDYYLKIRTSELGPYHVSVNIDADGSPLLSYDSIVECAASMQIPVEMDCYELAEVAVNGTLLPLDYPLPLPYLYEFQNIRGDSSLYANIVHKSYTLTATAGVGGQIIPQGDSTVLCGGSVDYVITADAGWEIDSVFVNGSYIGTPSVYPYDNVRDDGRIRVVFRQLHYTVSAGAGEGGFVTPTTADVTYGESVTIAITPEDCYHVTSVLVNGEEMGAIESYTFNNIRGDSTLQAYFDMDRYTLTATAGVGGQITPQGDSTVLCGGSVDYVIAADAGWEIDSVYEDGLYVGTPAHYRFDNVRDDGRIRVVFRQLHYTVSAGAGEGGSVTPTTADVTYGERVTIAITPEDCYHVTSVLVNGVEMGAIESYTFDNIRGDSTLQAYFDMDRYTLTATAGVGGQITPRGDSTVLCGGSVDYVIAADAGWEIDSVYEDGLYVGTPAHYRFDNVRDDGSIRVVFRQLHYTVSAGAGEGGSVTPTTADVTYGESVTIAITPEDCYHVTSVLVNGEEMGAIESYTFDNIRGDSTLQAYFDMDRYTLTATAGVGGQITPRGDSTVLCGGSVDYVIAADAGWEIDSVYEDGLYVGTPAHYRFDNVRDDGSIRVVFRQLHYTVSAGAGEGGSVTPTASDVTYGESVTIAITPEDCYHVTSVLVNGEEMGAIESYTFDNIQGDSTLQAYFDMDRYMLTATAGVGGQISPQGDSTVLCGGSVDYVITADAGWEIDSVYEDGLYVGTPAHYRFDNVRDDGSIRVVFRQLHYTVSAGAGEGGSVTPTASDVTYGESVTIAITPDDCYHVTSVLVNGVEMGAIESYTFDNILGDSTLQAYFDMDRYTLTATAGVGGQISPQGDSTVLCGGSVDYVITADAGWEIDSVYEDGLYVGTPAHYSFDNVRDDGSIRVVFRQLHYTVSAGAGEGGSVTPTTADVTYGESVTIAITPDDCYHVTSVLVNGEEMGAIESYTFDNIQGDSTLQAYFDMDRYTLTATAGVGGQITPQGDSTVLCGGSVDYVITADAGWEIDSVLVNDSYIGTPSVYLFDDVRDDGSIRVVFRQLHYTVSAGAGEGGSVTPTTTDVTYGENVTIAITPEDCYHVTSVVVNGADMGAIESYTFDNIRGDSTLQAYFDMDRYTLTATAGVGGQISPQGDSTVLCGGSVDYVITADAGWEIDSVLVNDSYIGTPSVYLFDDVRDDGSIRVVFRQLHYTVSAGAGEGGSVTPTTTEVTYGESVTIAITPDDCYHVTSVLVNGEEMGAIESYTFDNIRGDSTLQAYFDMDDYEVGVAVLMEGEFVFGDSLYLACGTDTVYHLPMFDCYTIDSILLNGEMITPNDSIALSNVRGNLSVEVYISREVYHVVITTQGNGTVTPMDTVQVLCDEDLTLTLLPDEGWYVENIVVDSVSMGTPPSNSYTLSHLHADATVEVVFSRNAYILQSSVDPIDAGQISPYGTTIAYYGDTVSYQIFAFPSYEIREVVVDGVSVGNISTYTFDFVEDNHTIMVYFETVGLEDEEAGKLSVYSSGTTIYLENTTMEPVKVMQVFDVQGRKVAQFESVENGFSVELNVVPGAYFVRVATRRGVQTFKVILSRL